MSDINNNAEEGRNKLINSPMKEEKRILQLLYSTLDRLVSLFSTPDRGSSLIAMTKKARRVGLCIIIGFFGVFGGWAIVAPMDGAIIAVGQVSIESDKTLIQHLEGGIIDEVFVKEGQKVAQGEAMMHLNSVAVDSQIKIFSEKLQMLKFTEARLVAESNNADAIDFLSYMVNNVDKEKADKMIENQNSIFFSRKSTTMGQINIMHNRIDQTNDEINGIEAQLNSVNRQVSLLSDELKNKQELLKNGYVSKSQIVPLEREYENFIGKAGEYQALLSRAKQRIGETELEVINIKNNFLHQVLNELKEVNSAIAELEPRINALNDILLRSVIKAPQSGTVTGIRYHTIGGIIPPGATIMEIVANDEVMIIEARVLPQNIESILTAQHIKTNLIKAGGEEGLKTKIRLTAFNSRKIGLLQGVLTYVSANTIADVHTGGHYYLAYIKVPSEEIDKIKSDIKMYPGMPVVVYIVTESRTLFSYLISPIVSTFDNAFRER